MIRPAVREEERAEVLPAPGPGRSRGLRGLVLGIALVPVAVAWVTYMELVTQAGWPTQFALLLNVVFILAVLVLLNRLLGRVAPRLTLGQADFAILYGMLVVAVALAGGSNILPTLLGLMGHAAWFASPENRYEQLFFQYLPDWLIHKDRAVVAGLYTGNANLYAPGVWQAWLARVLPWTLYVALIVVGMTALNALISHRWIHGERLTYPIAQLPVEMTRPGASMFRSRAFWATFALAAFINLGNGLNDFFPGLPRVTPALINLSQLVGGHPWNAIQMSVRLHPQMIGVGMLMPLDMTFSCWSLFLFQQAQKVGTAALGWDIVPEFPFTGDQSAVALIVVAAFSVLSARRYLAAAVRQAFGRAGESAPSASLGTGGSGDMSPRALLIWLFAGFAGVVALMQIAGLRAAIAVPWMLIFFALSLGFSRLRAQVGAPMNSNWFIGPEYLMTRLPGPGAYGPRDVTGFTLFYWFNREYGNHPSPHIADSFKFADQARASQRLLFTAIVIAAVVGTLSFFWIALANGYRWGAGSPSKGVNIVWVGSEQYDYVLSSWLNARPRFNYPLLVMMGFSLGFTTLLMVARGRFIGFGLHPLGYAVAGAWGMQFMWLDLMLAWLAKLIILRYWGMQGYRAILPAAFGIILGDTISGGFWAILGQVLSHPIYGAWAW